MKNNLIKYTHVKGYRYELEVAENLVAGNKKPKEFELTS